MNIKPNEHIKTHFITILIGFSQIYAWATTYYIPATLTNLVSKDIGYSAMWIIGGFSWALLIGGLFAPKIGRWIDAEGGRRPLTTGSICMGIGLLILSQTNGLFVWYTGWTFIGLGMALGLFNAAFATVGRLFGLSAKTIIVRITLISGFATLFWPITTYLIQSIGWRSMVLLYAIPHFVIWAPLFFFNIPKWIPPHQATHTTAEAVLPEKMKRIFYLLALYAILRSIVGTTISVDILTMFTGIGLTLPLAAIAASFIGPAQIAGRILEMLFGRHFDPLHSSIFWTAVLPTSILMLIIKGGVASTLFAIAYGMSNGVLTITMGILPMILFGSNGYATLLGKLALPVLIAQAATPLLIDPLIQNWPSRDIFILCGVLGVASLFCLILLSLFSKKVPEKFA